MIMGDTSITLIYHATMYVSDCTVVSILHCDDMESRILCAHRYSSMLIRL